LCVMLSHNLQKKKTIQNNNTKNETVKKLD
jgi:hypothetical protein